MEPVSIRATGSVIVSVNRYDYWTAELIKGEVKDAFPSSLCSQLTRRATLIRSRWLVCVRQAKFPESHSSSQN